MAKPYPKEFRADVVAVARKRKTLPNNFAELLATGDLDALKKVYDDCHLDAYGGPAKATALSFDHCPDELTRWLVGQGLDVDTPDAFGNTAMADKAGRDKPIGLLIELGANVDAAGSSGYTPLHRAIPRSPRNVLTLLEHGADMFARNSDGRTPLQAALTHCSNAQIQEVAKSARILLAAGCPIPDDAAERVTQIGERFQRILDQWGPEHHGETITALNELYAMFGVTPVAPRKMHDGVSPITVAATAWQAQFDELWDYLVPSSGNALTMQGEVIRSAGRICHELLDNGGINWNRDFVAMKRELIADLASGTPVTTADELAELSVGINRDTVDDEPLRRITELAVAWVLANPDPVRLSSVLDRGR